MNNGVLSLLDATQLAEIAELEAVRPGLKVRMIELFTESTRVGMRDVRAGMLAGDFRKVSQAAHRLRGNAASLGAPRINALAAGLESRAINGERVRTQDVTRLSKTVDDTIEAYRQWLAQ